LPVDYYAEPKAPAKKHAVAGLIHVAGSTDEKPALKDVTLVQTGVKPALKDATPECLAFQLE
jgi:hypothetical protein